MIDVDITKVPLIDKTFRHIKVIALPAATPGYAVLEFAGDDGARLSVWWNGAPALAVNDFVRVLRIGEDGQLVITGNDAGTDKIGIRITETHTSTGTMSDTVEVAICNSASAMVLTLPAHVTDKEIRIVNINTGVVTLTPTSGTVKGVATETLDQWESLIFLSDGTNWL